MTGGREEALQPRAAGYRSRSGLSNGNSQTTPREEGTYVQ
jgi:hypothetical protein